MQHIKESLNTKWIFAQYKGQHNSITIKKYGNSWVSHFQVKLTIVEALNNGHLRNTEFVCFSDLNYVGIGEMSAK